MTLYTLTNENYRPIRESDTAVIAVGVSWCGSCRIYEGSLEKASEKFPGVNFGIAVLDKGGLGDLKRDYPAVEFVPLTLFFRQGLEVRRETGYKTSDYLAKVINSLLPHQ